MKDLFRRRSPGWVRAMDQRELHALAFHLRNVFIKANLSPKQDWLFEMCLNELAYRQRARQRDTWGICACELCFDAPWEIASDSDGSEPF